MTSKQIETLMGSFQMKPDDRVLWEIALQLALLREQLAMQLNRGENP